MRIEWNGKGPPADTVSVTNGNDTWLYYRQSRAFGRPDSRLYLARTPHEAMSALESWPLYEHILDGVRSVRLAGREPGSQDRWCGYQLRCRHRRLRPGKVGVEGIRLHGPDHVLD